MATRYGLFVAGLYIMASGIALTIKAGLGASSISCWPYVLSLKYPVSLGTFVFGLNVILIIGQMIILKHNFKKIQYLQIPVSFLFSAFIDLSMLLFVAVVPESYPARCVVLLAGCILTGLGISLEVTANVVMLSAEAFIQAVVVKSGKEFGYLKICFDMSCTLLASVSSLLLLGGISGVREGTVAAAIFVGLFARFFLRMISRLRKRLIRKIISAKYLVNPKTSPTFAPR